MCDTMVSVPAPGESGDVWLAKNSDREPSEAQLVEHHLAAVPRSRVLRATHVEIPEATATLEVAISRPAWMWGAEMGVNERGVAIGNEALFTRIPVADKGLTGMDLLRIALERATSADDALDVITWMIGRYGQGGRCGHRNASFRYHDAFLIADPRGAWLLETAGPYWAAARVEGTRTSSNVLTLGEEATRFGPGTIEHARARGFGRRGEPLRFRDAFADRALGLLSGGGARRVTTARMLGAAPRSVAAFARALRDHAGHSARQGLRITSPCAHASYLPTRTAGQTTASMIVRLGARERLHLFTGTSSPCLSVLKPVPLGRGQVDTGPPPGERRFDGESLFWRHERLHRAVLRDEAQRRPLLEPLRDALEHDALLGATRADAARASALFEEHRAALPGWLDRVSAAPPSRRAGPFDVYWRALDLLDGVPRPSRVGFDR